MGTQLPPRRAQPPHPIFGPCLLCSNGWMEQDATCYRSRPRPRPHCVRRGPSCPRKRGTTTPSLFSAIVCCGHGRASQLTAELMLWSPYGIGQTIIVSSCAFFFFLLFFFFFSSPILSRRKLDVYHTSTHGAALVRIQNAVLKFAARGSLKMQDAKIVKN